jgi:two-component system response regulator YesN
MYKVLIVDDEKQIVDGLCKMIKWNELGFEACGTARNGAEAITLIKSLKADLVVTDVRMPVMDGLRMVEYVRSNISDEVEFIILSGFSEFHYAQKALKYKVKNYILKPIDEEELYGSLIDIRNALDEREIRKSLKVKSFISSYIAGGNTDSIEDMLESEETYGLRYIAVELFRDLDSMLSQSGERQMCDLSGSIAGKIGESNMKFVLQNDGNQCHMIAGKSLLSSFGYSVRDLAQSIGEYLLMNRSVRTDILIGKKVSGFKELHDSIQSICLCRNRLFYTNSASTVIYDDIKDHTSCKVYEDNGAVVSIIAAFRRNDMETLVAGVDNMAKHMEQIKLIPEIALAHFDSVMASVIQILSERTDESSKAVALYSKYRTFQNKLRLHDLSRFTKDFCLFCNELMLKRQKSDKSDIVEKAARYVEENYMEPLKIIDIADRFYVNPAYLGQQFIRKKGCSLNYYINKVRMEKAKELLLSTDLKIYEIAREIGFDDPNYFSSKFFECYNQTPSDFRSNNRK